VRIFGGGRPIGVLVLADKEVRRAARRLRRSTTRTGASSYRSRALCGIAIENRRHLDRLTRERERLEEENRRLLDETGRSAAGRLFVGDSPAARAGARPRRPRRRFAHLRAGHGRERDRARSSSPG
jgi:hypothetical protein